MRVRLKRDSLEADIAPETGGAIAAFRHDGRDIFTPAEPRGIAEFPMGPYVNRIAHGRFHWHGETIQLPRNFGEHPHPLHGVGWQRAWVCVQTDASTALLTLEHTADADWPWSVRMVRRISLVPDGLQIAFTLTNADVVPMPASIGLHPFFPAAGAIVSLMAPRQVLTSVDGIPVGIAPTAAAWWLFDGMQVEARALDHCFGGWDGRAEIAWPTHKVHIETDPPLPFVQVFTPPGAAFFCVEPQTAMPDAVNQRDSGVTELAPGEALTITVRFTVEVR